MADAAADGEASNATANATDADAVAAAEDAAAEAAEAEAEAAAEDATANAPDADAEQTSSEITSSLSSSIQPDNDTTSGGNLSAFTQSTGGNISITPGGSTLADKFYSPDSIEDEKKLAQKDVADSIRKAISIGAEIPDVSGFDENNATIYIKVNVNYTDGKK
jgi:membrane protein involved in colicin uptake